jgi:hypothetical protein
MQAVSPYSMLRNFGGDFGNGVDFQFTVGYQMSTGELSAHKWNLYPNPAYDKVTVDFHAELMGNYTFRVLDLLGREVHRQQVPLTGETSYTLELRHLPAGSYVLSSHGPGGWTRSDRFLMGSRP